MEKKGLTARKVKFIKHGPERIEIPAGPPGGLMLVVHPSGKKTWALRYRFGERTRKGTVGTYPKMSLGKARVQAVADLEKVESGIDPYVVVSDPEPIPEKHDSVESVGEEWLKRHVKPNTKPKSAIEFERILRRELFTVWKDKKDGEGRTVPRLITDITKPDVLRVLDAIVDRDAPIAANRTFEVMRMWGNWCVDRGYLVTSFTAGVSAPSSEESRDRVLDDNELAEVWNASEAFGYPLGPYIRFLTLTMQRRGEVATMRWKDVHLEKAIWTMPVPPRKKKKQKNRQINAKQQVNKGGRVHDIQLSDAALEILKALPRFKYINAAGEEVDGEYVWTTTSGRKPINGFSKNKVRIDKETLKRRKEAALKAGLDPDKVENIDHWQVHDLRRTASSDMADAERMGKDIPPHVIDAILNHAPEELLGVGAIYNRFKYVKERRAALQAWADFVLRLVEPEAKAATA